MRCCKIGCSMLSGLLICCCLQGQFYFYANNKSEPELSWELGGSTGIMNCLTDIGGKSGSGKKFIKDINWNKTRFCGSILVSAAWESKYAIRLEATFGQVTGSDDVLKNATGVARSRYYRNLQFKSTITELALISELHILPALFKNSGSLLLSPYLAAGIGFFNYTPQAKLYNVWIDLRSLHTEGEGFAEYAGRHMYKTISWCVPVGAGVKYDPSGLITLRFEILYRFTGTDYLDDVSNTYIDPALFSKYLTPTAAALAVKLYDRSAELSGGSKNSNNAIRGNPANKDAFFSLLLKISIALGRVQRK